MSTPTGGKPCNMYELSLTSKMEVHEHLNQRGSVFSRDKDVERSRSKNDTLFAGTLFKKYKRTCCDKYCNKARSKFLLCNIRDFERKRLPHGFFRICTQPFFINRTK